MCHLWTAAWQGWLCISDILCSRCTHSWSVAGFPNLCRNVKLWVVKLNKFVDHTVSFDFVDVELMTPGPFICEKLPEYQPFRYLFWRDVWHLAPLRGKSQPYIDELQILSCLCMPSHVIACLTACTSQHQREHQTFDLLFFCEENPLVTGGFPSQRANGAEKVSISWRISWTRDHEVSQKTR